MTDTPDIAALVKILRMNGFVASADALERLARENKQLGDDRHKFIHERDHYRVALKKAEVERDALADKLALVKAEISKTGEWAPLSDRIADILEDHRRD